MQSLVIAPSILAADLARLGAEVDAVLKAGADWIHFDVMDNHYVPNLSFGPDICKSLRNYGIQVPIDVHLMVKPVDRLVELFAKAGADSISFHPDASDDIDGTINLIKQHGCKVGIVLNPQVSIDVLHQLQNKIDLVLLMSVNPGFGGQAFIPQVLDKAKQLRKMLDSWGTNTRLQMDGGINQTNIQAIAASGVDTFVAGSAIFGYPQKDYVTAIQKLREAIK